MSVQPELSDEAAIEDKPPREKLLFRLRKGNAKFHANDVEYSERRQGVVIVLNGVIEFLRSYPESCAEHLGVPLAVLATALEDLEDSVTHPLLIAAANTGRPPNSTTRKQIIGFVAAGIDMMVSHGVKQYQAAKEIAELLRRKGFWNHGGSKLDITAETVLAWRENVLWANPNPDLDPMAAAAIAYKFAMDERQPAANMNMYQVKSYVLQGIEDIITGLRAADGEGVPVARQQ